MTTEKIYLKEGNEKVNLVTYISDDSTGMMPKPRPAMIVIPGGAYMFLADREGEPVVKKFFAEGFNCFLLNYSIAPNAAFPEPLREISLAIIHIKENAEKYNVDPERVYVCGFSAGGHLAASIGTMWHQDKAKPYEDMPYGLNKPRGMVLCYPWITLDEHYRNNECALNVSGGEITEEKIQTLSAEKQVSDKTVPAYIWTTGADDCVDVMNTFLMAEAMAKNNIPYELHIFQGGRHGMVLANHETSYGGEPVLESKDVATWIDEAITWCKNN